MVAPQPSWSSLARSIAAIFILAVVVAAGVAAARRAAAFPETRFAKPAAAASQWAPFGAGALTYVDAQATAFHSGRISAIAVDPRSSARWLVGVGNGGVWETRDAGTTWRPITDDAPTLSIGAVAFAPGNPDIVYVATGEPAGGSGFLHVGVGLLKSVNGGQTWALSGEASFSRSSVRRLIVDPQDANVLLAANGRGGFGRDSFEGAPSPPPFGIHRSIDGGANWTRTLAGQASELAADPTNFSRQYAAIADQRVGTTAISRDTPNPSPNGLYRSTDGGRNWTRVDGPWGSEPSSTRSAVGRIEAAIAPSNPNVMYVGIQIPPNGGTASTGLLGLYRTDNAWADTPAWIQIPTGATGAGGYCGAGASGGAPVGKCGYSHVLTVDPRDANTLFAGGESWLWKCSSCAGSPAWAKTTLNGNANNPNVHPDYHALTWAGNRLIAGNDGGVWSTPDLGATWQSHNRELPTKMFYSGALHPTDPDFALGGFRDFALTVYRPATGWRVQRQASTSEWGEAEVAISSSRPETDWMAAWLNGVIQRTTDGGRTSLRVDGPIDKTGAAFVAPVRKCPANDNVFLAGTARIWRTNEFFAAPAPGWVALTPARQFPTPGFTAITDPTTILSIAYIESDRTCNSFAYGNRGGEVTLSRDGGASWTNLDPSRTLPARSVNGLAFDPSNPNRMFAVLSNFNEATPTRPGHIFRTDNALSSSPTWSRVGPPDVPFANMPFNVVAVDPRDTRIVYAGSDNGLWESTDGGNNWVKVGLESGMPPATVHDIQINPTTNRTVVFTYGRGAFELVR